MNSLHKDMRCYLELLARLGKSVRNNRPELWPEKWILNHGNAPAHDTLRIREFLTKKFITRIGPSILFTRLGSLRFSTVSKIKKWPEWIKAC
jgi:hypothetical protein